MCNEKYRKLETYLQELTREDLCIAFSGGIDSSLLLKMATSLSQRKKVYAVTFSTKLHPQADVAIAKEVAKECGAEFVVMEVDERDNPLIANNPIDRCYHCKKYLFQKLKTWAEERGIKTILDGTNADDLTVYRPGLKALDELHIISPLADASLSKEEIRRIGRTLGLSVSNRPSAPCMATRLPYGTPIDYSILGKLEEGEVYIQSLGFSVVRLRLHEDIIRIEIEKEKFLEFLKVEEAITKKMKELGFCYITLDLEGFRSGSMDIKILEKNKIYQL